VAHTIKGRGLRCEAMSGNHSAMLEEDEVRELRKKVGLFGDDLYAFERFDEKSPEGKYLKDRGDFLTQGIQACEKLKKDNLETFKKETFSAGLLENFPKSLDINLKFVPFIHTQWILGQMSAKLNRIADTYIEGVKQEKPLTEGEKLWKPIANHLITLAPDVGSSTNLNASMDGKVFAPDTPDYELEYGVKDENAPDIVPKENESSRHLRFEIAEGNAMSCMGSLGKMGYFTGIPLVPIMTIYDFFIKRALDQLFYNSYWKSRFILVGTPSGITLSPEGAQHAWKSDIQIANLITWEPAYALEFEWIFVDALRRHVDYFCRGEENADNTLNRAGVLIRGVTRAIEQKEMLNRLKKHKRFTGKTDADILESTRKDCLEGGYYAVDYRGYPNYNPGENVVTICSMGALITESLKASDLLLEKGIYANVIQVSSPDLLCGTLGADTNYAHLRKNLGVTGDLHLKLYEGAAKSDAAYPPKVFGPLSTPVGRAQTLTLGGRRVPIVSVHDGEHGLLDSLGGVVGTLQKALAVRKHSKSGRPADIYAYHGLDGASVAKACEEALAESAFTVTSIAPESLAAMGHELHS
jgi:pyruvate dehydrogenase E1 component